jgi:nickel/cobalt transporter (NiCoT) family protein
MPTAFAPPILLSALLGMRHGLDADHLAAIDGLSRLHVSANRLRLARLSGLLFSLGHSTVVLGAALALRSQPARIPAWLDGVGSLIAISLLLFLGVLNLDQALRLGQGRAATPLAAFVERARFTRNAFGGFLTGILFALSFDTLTIAAWFGAVGLNEGGASTVLLLALAFAAGMIACDGLNGLWVAHLINRSQAFAVRARRAFSALVALIALGIAAAGIFRLASEGADAWFERRALWVSAALMILLLAGFWLSKLTMRSQATEQAGALPHP